MLNTKEEQLNIQVQPSEGILQSNEIFKRLMETRRKLEIEKTHNKHNLKVYKYIYINPCGIKAFLEGPEETMFTHPYDICLQQTNIGTETLCTQMQ